ncbi:divergent polysaccharide deacetylase family protein [Brucepastera parasyntrophica]|uniref:divergent polysaccharide deacetylase family protein n=1 Tax=Brucepastera parasyntrophica TaxID=2880008 RepID=UPI00210A658E|nr:divergent polysaccharide deacetylase family protein [Brucepastera parasyntrophica]
MMENGNRKKPSGTGTPKSPKRTAARSSGKSPKKNTQGTAPKKKAPNKKTKGLKDRIRINLILLGAVFAFSVLLFLGKVLISGVSDPSGNEPPLITENAPVAGENKPPVTETVPEKPPEILPEIPSRPAVPAAPPEKPLPPVPRKSSGTLVFVFDDAGHNLNQLQPFLDLPFPCTIAVLPGLQYSKEAADRIRAAGKELILHQPMQAENLSFDPGPGAIMPGMTRAEIKEIIRKNIREVGPVAGMNNHEGSLITADWDAMDAVLELVREEGIFFLDSRTTANTAAPAIAREKNMTIWERSVFLDNSQEKKI